MTEDEIRQAEEKFAESLHLAQMGMHNILDNDVNKKLLRFSLSIFYIFLKPQPGGANSAIGLFR